MERLTNKENTVDLCSITQKLDSFFSVRELQTDPAMSKFIPMVYDRIGFDWRKSFEPDFVLRCNGLMIKGSTNVSTVFCSVFPTSEVLQKFIGQSKEGDMLFLHHPIDIQSGDPNGELGNGFQPMELSAIQELKSRNLSVYVCHAPMDCNNTLGTNSAIVRALKARITSEFLPYGNGFAGKICEISPENTDTLILKLLKIFGIPYVDFRGKEVNDISKIAVVSGGGTDIESMREAEEKGAQCYISGEIVNRIDNNFAKKERVEEEKYATETTMGLIGVSHAASEFLVMRTQLAPWLRDNFGIKAKTIPLSRWWR